MNVTNSSELYPSQRVLNIIRNSNTTLNDTISKINDDSWNTIQQFLIPDPIVMYSGPMCISKCLSTSFKRTSTDLTVIIDVRFVTNGYYAIHKQYTLMRFGLFQFSFRYCTGYPSFLIAQIDNQASKDFYHNIYWPTNGTERIGFTIHSNKNCTVFEFRVYRNGQEGLSLEEPGSELNMSCNWLCNMNDTNKMIIGDTRNHLDVGNYINIENLKIWNISFTDVMMTQSTTGPKKRNRCVLAR